MTSRRRHTSPRNSNKGEFAALGNRNRFRSKNAPRTGKGDTKKDMKISIPSLTPTEGPFPTFFSCRHTYEEHLMTELRRHGTCLCFSPFEGMVLADGISDDTLDPVYALQILPNCHVLTAPSIKSLATVAIETLDQSVLQSATRGSLVIHGLVPGMFKGQPAPVWQRRVSTVADEVAQTLRKTYACARRKEDDTQDGELLLQLLLFSPEVMAVSLSSTNRYWPQWRYPAGLAPVDIKESMPSSAYRKLMEAFACMGTAPSSESRVVDLGASPGGWTAALRRLGSRVIAIDRSPLREDLMNDEKVSFVQGDAFAYSPDTPVDWMVSDVIAYPDRVHELLNNWCKQKWADYMIVTVKFQGAEVPFEELDKMITASSRYGYSCRVKHFFNNKNEVTMMIQRDQ